MSVIDPKFKIGDVVAASYGSTFWPDVIFTIESVSPNHGGYGWHRYWGSSKDGRCHGAYEGQLALVG